MIRRGRKKESRSAGFVGCAAWGSGKVFTLLLSEMHQVGDVGRSFCCVQDKIHQCRSPGRACYVLAPCNASASNTGTMAVTTCWSYSMTTLFFNQHLFRLNGPSRQHGRVALHWRGRIGGARQDGNKSVLLPSCG